MCGQIDGFGCGSSKHFSVEVVVKTLEEIILKNGRPAVTLYGAHTHLHMNPSAGVALEAFLARVRVTVILQGQLQGLHFLAPGLDTGMSFCGLPFRT